LNEWVDTRTGGWIHRRAGGRVGRLADWQIGRLADWQIGRLAERLMDRGKHKRWKMKDRQTDRLTSRSGWATSVKMQFKLASLCLT
jgi:hypothetical protein